MELNKDLNENAKLDMELSLESETKEINGESISENEIISNKGQDLLYNLEDTPSIPVIISYSIQVRPAIFIIGFMHLCVASKGVREK